MVKMMPSRGAEVRELAGWCEWLGRSEAREDGRREMMIEGSDFLILMQARRAVCRRYPHINQDRELRRQALHSYLEGYKDINGES